MGWPIVENLSELRGSIFNLFRGPYLNFGKKSKKGLIFIKIQIFSVFFYMVCLGSIAGVVELSGCAFW